MFFSDFLLLSDRARTVDHEYQALSINEDFSDRKKEILEKFFFQIQLEKSPTEEFSNELLI